jgi:putative hemolysin
MRRSILIAGLGALALTGCTSATPPQPQAGGQSFARDMSTADRTACISAGGRVERRGRLGAELCVRPFADAGKACTDSAQCQGKCVSQGNAETPAQAGQCQADDRLFGCYSEIKDGKAASTICVD